MSSCKRSKKLYKCHLSTVKCQKKTIQCSSPVKSEAVYHDRTWDSGCESDGTHLPYTKHITEQYLNPFY